ncbi:MAG: hypothetical protein ACM3ST_06270 [Bdellovibrio bacteriovorus]
MRKPLLILALAGTFGLTQQAAMADHNSPHGAGWARMPNDIHNTRIDTLGDNTAFRDFVRYGNGADSTNRFLTDSRGGRSLSQGRGTGAMQRGGGAGGRGGRGGR